ncbi:hypothetical protein AVEN_208260-1 [Araneus ventricosus]|uniref:Reverse transcriptase domain-containing protein n=1 Tax=Araneus ventricosus TaxID=182803 RepID=A0A4Y2M1P8_ARAVE|nr:hypothetical protein AVEN_208260-1 [Araneus ventricosus]
MQACLRAEFWPLIFSYFLAQQRNITLSLYADDTAILAQCSSPLPNYIVKLKAWLIRWKIQLNVDKTEAIVFFKNLNNWPKITIYNTPINWKDEIKYLGVIIDKNLNFRSHINQTREKSNKAFRAQYSVICRNSGLSIENQLLIYSAYLRPIITYASPI